MSSTNNQTEKSKAGRSATSCLECQRRKQKVLDIGGWALTPLFIVSRWADAVTF